MNKKRPKRMPLMAQYFPSLSETFDVHQYVHMFTEDIHLGIMPIRGSSERHNEYNAIINGSESDIELITRICLSLSEYNHHYESNKLIADAVETIARNLSWAGIAFYEIVNDKDDSSCPYLQWFTTKRLFKIPGHFVQILPKPESLQFKRKFTIINSSRVWKVTMPPELGGEHEYIKILKTIKKTNSLTPKFAQKDMGLFYTTPGYDYKEYNRNHDVLINRLTSNWGWNRRDTHDDNCTEFYTVYKHVCSALAKTIFREHIICEINKLLQRLRIKGSIEIIGLPTSEDILKTRKDLIQGTIDFDQAFRKASVY
jgi:hypothetical protein